MGYYESVIWANSGLQPSVSGGRRQANRAVLGGFR